MAKYYILGIGGSGALAIESLIHLCANGIVGDNELIIKIIDPDETNENVQRTQRTIQNYIKVRSEMKQGYSEFFKTSIVYKGVWNPNKGDNYNLEKGISYVQLNQENNLKFKFLTNLLFSEEKRLEKLDKGYKGNPMIGTIFMKDFEEDDIYNEMISEPSLKLFVFGSLFGGTGAAGLPVMGKSLKSNLSGASKKSYIGSCIFLPYFNVKKPSEKQDIKLAELKINLKPDSDNFLPAIKFAIPFYLDKAESKDNGYDSIYFLGCPDSFENSQIEFAMGGPDQKNKSHYINLFAVSSFLDFIQNEDISVKSRDSMIFATSVNKEEARLNYKNLPLNFKETDCKHIEAFYVSSLFYLKYFLTEGKNTPASMTWFNHENKGLNLNESFFNNTFTDDLKTYFDKFLVWYGQISNNIVNLETFNTDFYDIDNDVLSINNFSDDKIGAYLLWKENPKPGFFTKKPLIQDLNSYFNNVTDDVKSIGSNDFQKFLDILYKGSFSFIKKNYKI